jgi:ketosteroid isomerase-like protein
MDTAALNDLADRLFDAFVAHDLDAVEAMMAPDAVLVQNGKRSTFAESRVWLETITQVLGDHRYEEVRRIAGDGAIVEEHQVRSTTPGGQAIDLAACVVIRVDDAGRIVSLDEYVDTAPLAGLG